MGVNGVNILSMPADVYAVNMPAQDSCAMTGRRPYHHGDLRGALLRATEELIEHHGVAAFSLRAAADEVGVSPSAVYRHFRDKDALLRAAAAAVLTDVGAHMDSAVEERDARDLRGRLLAVAVAYLGFALEHPERYRLVFGPHGLGRKDGLGEDAGPHRPQQHFDELAAMAVAGPLAGRDEVDVARSLWLVVHGAVALTVDGPFDQQRALTAATSTLDALLQAGHDDARTTAS